MPNISLTLIIAAFLTSTLSGTIGMGGGIILMAVMAPSFPPQILIPLHGAIQLVSNGARTFMAFGNVQWSLVRPYVVGALLGAAAGSMLVVQIPERQYKIVLGLFVLAITFIPMPQATPKLPGKWFLVGMVSTFLGLFVGATGPLIAPFYLSEKLDRRQLVATKAAGQTVLHVLKVLVFMGLGFSLAQYAGLIGVLGLTVIFGNRLGMYLLSRVSERFFIIIFKIAIAVLSFRLLYQAI